MVVRTRVLIVTYKVSSGNQLLNKKFCLSLLSLFWLENVNEYYPLHTAEYSTAFLLSNWLYSIWHQINI